MALVERSKMGFWQAFQPSQEPLELLVAAGKESACRSFKDSCETFRDKPLGLWIQQRDPDFTVFKDLDGSACVEVLDYIPTARVEVQTFDDYWKSSGNLARYRRNLAKNGIQHALLIATLPPCPECLRIYGELEANGWKAARGSNVSVHSKEGEFYLEIMTSFCAQDEGFIFCLTFNGRTVTSQPYDEAYRRFSPGYMLLRRRQCSSRGILWTGSGRVYDQME
jgi:hypothetical protein